MNHSFTTKELPESERPYEKFWKYGATALSDAELLAIVIKSGSSKMTAVDVARSFLSQKDRNLMNLYEMSYDEMKKIHGIGDVIAMQLKCIAELSTRIANTRHFEGIQMRSAATVAEYYMEQLRHEQQEKLIVCMFDSKCKWLGDSVVTTGSVSSSIVPPREIFICALEKKAVHIVMVHNHPSGRAVPSGEDNTVTARIAEAGKLLGIALSDHIIIGDRTYFSYREAGNNENENYGFAWLSVSCDPGRNGMGCRVSSCSGSFRGRRNRTDRCSQCSTGSSQRTDQKNKRTDG